MANHQFITRAAICGLLLVNLSACTYLIPDDPSVPRYNQVQGDRHKPERNVNVPDGPQSDNSAAVSSFTGSRVTERADAGAAWTTPAPQSTPMPMTPTPVMPVAEANLPPLPPVDAATQARAEREMAMNSPAPHINERRAPIENPSDQLALNDANPISSVPPRPTVTGSDTPQARAIGIRRDLEHERATSRDMKAQLATDAANEPSDVAPESLAPAPIVSAPIPPSPVPSAPRALPPISEALPPPPSYIAPVPLQSASSVSYNPMAAPIPPANEPLAQQGVPQPMESALPPIHLTPPSNMAANAPAPVYLQPQYTPTPAAATGSSFDPFAANAPARAGRATYASSDYLPASRYASKRD